MLSHRSGLEEVGMLWDHTTLSRHELMEKMRYLKPVVGFHAGWVYNNLMLLSAGEIIPIITGKSWDDFITERIFGPLGMMRSNTSTHALQGRDNVAAPHCIIDNKVHSIAYHNIDCIAPAGGINSTIQDMAQWVRLQVNAGVYNGVRIMTEDTINEMWAAQAIVKKNYPWQVYGLGLGSFDYHGNRVVFHEGNIDGMSASFAVLPEKKIGIIILTNMHKGTIGKVILNYVFDKYLGVKPVTDWNKNLLDQAEKKRTSEYAAKEKKEAERLTNAQPSFDVSRCVGVYHSDLYGNLVISQAEGSGMQCQFLAFNGELKHWENDSFVFNPSQNYPLFTEAFSFVFSVHNGKIASVRIQYPDEMDGVFIKIH